MTAATQRRLLTASTSKLTKADLVRLLRRDEAWASIPQTTRETLYALLPPPGPDEPERNVDVHPLQTRLKPYIEAEILRWQRDLSEGREGKKWREDAIVAGKERDEGKLEMWKDAEVEEAFGAAKEPRAGKADVVVVYDEADGEADAVVIDDAHGGSLEEGGEVSEPKGEAKTDGEDASVAT